MSVVEFRNASGELRAFEVAESATSFGALCGELEKVSGVRFHRSGLLHPRPASPFSLNGKEFEVSLMNDGLWVGPVAGDATHPEIELLHRHVCHRVVGSFKHKLLARFFPG